ncbi:MAG: hypothetical protein KJ804_21475 [Proteobacteria bacterium]|nr:hypothetical protein [Pseudomonadota bacterium]MBU1060882.1 hypothetical protein [Pseudomonadota bacterium]
MGQFKKVTFWALWTAVVVLSIVPEVGWTNDLFGGITFVGDRKDICVTIEGECISSIDFQLETCDSSMNSKEEYKNKMPFTLLVPKGAHQLLIKKKGKIVVNEPINIEAEKVLEYQLPE